LKKVDVVLDGKGALKRSRLSTDGLKDSKFLVSKNTDKFIEAVSQAKAWLGPAKLPGGFARVPER